jgi:hypothetical protein
VSEIDSSPSDADERTRTARTLARNLWRPRAQVAAVAPVLVAGSSFFRDDTATLLWTGVAVLLIGQALIGLLYVCDVRRFGG